MAAFEIKSTEKLIDLIKAKQIKVGDIIIHHCDLCGRWVMRKYKRVNLCDKENYLKLWCQKCKTEYKYLHTFGTKYPFRDKNFRESILYAGMKKKFGKPHALQIDELREKAYETTKDHFNSDHPFSCDEMIKKYKQGNLKKYGVEWSLQNSNIKEKAKQTMLKEYGYENLFYSKDFQDSVKRYWKNKFGVNNASQILEIRDKAKQTMLEKYHMTISEYNKTEECQNKIRNTLLKTTGFDHVIAKKYNYFNNYFDSSWELAIWIYYTTNGFLIQREPISFEYFDAHGIIHKYYPDFWIAGIGYVEIKGDQFFDDNGNMINPYSKKHHNSNLLTQEEKVYYNSLYELKHQCALQNGVIFWTSKDIKPYIDYCNLYHSGWDMLYRKDNLYNPTYWCLYYNNQSPQYYYFPKMMNQQGITPYDLETKDKYAPTQRLGITPFDIKIS